MRHFPGKTWNNKWFLGKNWDLHLWALRVVHWWELSAGNPEPGDGSGYGADPGGEEEIAHPWVYPETPSIPRKILWNCWLRFNGTSWVAEVFHEHLGLSKREVIPDPFCYFSNFAFYVGNWSMINFRTLLGVLNLLVVIPWFFLGYSTTAELIPCFPEEIFVILMNFVAFLQTFTWSSTSSRGYTPHRGALSLDFNPREL